MYRPCCPQSRSSVMEVIPELSCGTPFLVWMTSSVSRDLEFVDKRVAVRINGIYDRKHGRKRRDAAPFVCGADRPGAPGASLAVFIMNDAAGIHSLVAVAVIRPGAPVVRLVLVQCDRHGP